jgi:hypothetical protein
VDHDFAAVASSKAVGWQGVSTVHKRNNSALERMLLRAAGSGFGYGKQVPAKPEKIKW